MGQRLDYYAKEEFPCGYTAEIDVTLKSGLFQKINPSKVDDDTGFTAECPLHGKSCPDNSTTTGDPE